MGGTNTTGMAPGGPVLDATAAAVSIAVGTQQASICHGT